MKKLLVITVIFALVAGAAFAETTVGGSLELGWTIAENAKSDAVTKADTLNAAFFLEATNDEGNIGGMAKFVLAGYGPNGGQSWEFAPKFLKFDRTFIWWQPIEQIKLFLGRDGDGLFNTANLTRWGHHQMPRNIAREDWQAGNYFLGNWDRFGMALMIYPMEGLQINLALDLPTDMLSDGWRSPTVAPNNANRDELTGAQKWEDVFKSIQLQVGYNLDGVGTFFVTYQGNGPAFRHDVGGNAEDEVGDRIGFTYQSASFVEGLSFELGLAYSLQSDDKSAGVVNGRDKEQDPLRIGLGIHYASGDFGVKTRFFFHPDRDKVKDGAKGFFYVYADLMPYYTLSIGTIYLNINIETLGKDADDKDIIGWAVTPYFRMPFAGDFRIGLNIGSSTAKDAGMDLKLATTWLINF